MIDAFRYEKDKRWGVAVNGVLIAWDFETKREAVTFAKRYCKDQVIRAK